MKLNRIALIVVLIFSLACNFITSGLIPATSTPIPTPTSTPLTPAYIPPNCDGIALATVSPATGIAVPTPILQANPPISRNAQLKVFDRTVQIVTQVYVYPDYNGKNWNEIQSRYKAKVEAGLNTEDFYTQMEAMIAELGDDHSSFDSPVEVAASNAELAGRDQFVGIGVFMLPQIDKGHATVIGIFPDSPAEHSRIQLHDTLLAVDGHPLIENGQSYLYAMRGPECSLLRLTVQSPGQPPRDMMIVRHKIEGGLPVDSRLIPTMDGSRIGYIFIPSFFDETIPGKVATALKNFGKLDGLILDNRMNGGGSSDVLDEILSYFISGTLGIFKSRTASRPLKIKANPIGNSDTVPLVVLVGTNTVSYGEVFSGVLQDNKRAKIIGQTTLGNVETLHGYNLEDGSQLWIAQETFDPAVSHANWEQTGLIPDVQAFADWDTFTLETDPSVAAALRLLDHP